MSTVAILLVVGYAFVRVESIIADGPVEKVDDGDGYFDEGLEPSDVHAEGRYGVFGYFGHVVKAE